MGMSKYESEVKHLACSQQEAFERMSDLRNLEQFKDQLNDPDRLEAVREQVGDEKFEEIQQMREKISVEADAIALETPVGPVRMAIVEREEPKLIKLEGVGSPVPLNLWIQLLPDGEEAAKMRVTVGAEVSMFLRPMISGPLTKAANGLADLLASIH